MVCRKRNIKNFIKEIISAMKPVVHFATENSFCPTPFYEKKGSTATPNIMDALGLDTPYSSPAVVEDESDRRNMAGRTPHNKLADASKNVELFNQNLLNGSMFKMDKFMYNSQSPLVNLSETPNLDKSLVVQNTTPLSMNSKMMLFGPPTEVKQPQVELTAISPENSNVLVFSAPNHAERITFAMPAESENNSRARKVVATPFFERPKVIKGTPYACKSFTSEASSVDENYCPNISRSQVSPDASPLHASIAAAVLEKPSLSTDSSLDLDFYTRSAFRASPLSATASNISQDRSYSTSSSPMGLFSSPHVSPKQSPSSPVASSRAVSLLASPVAVVKQQQQQIYSEDQEDSLHNVASVAMNEVEAVLNIAVGIPPLAPRDVRQIRGALTSTQPTASDLVTPNSSVNSLQMMFGSPAVLNRAGGVAKGRGPAMSAIPMQPLSLTPQAPPVKTVAVTVRKEPEAKKPPVPIQTAVVRSSTATANALLHCAAQRKPPNAICAASPIGKPLTAHPAARVARKIPYTPKKAAGIVSSSIVPNVTVVEPPAVVRPSIAVVAERTVVAKATKAVEVEAPFPAVSHMCNVSIQCSDSLLDIVLPVSAKPSKTRSPVHAQPDHLADMTGISSVGDSSTCSSQMHGDLHHSPMFTSYYRTQHDSDSEVDDLELGLFELLQGGGSAETSAIAPTRPAPVVTPSLTNKSVSSHGCGRTTGSKSSLRSASPSSFSTNLSFKSTAGVLGSARRVSLQEQLHASEVSDSEEEEEETSLASLLSSSTKTGRVIQRPFDTAQCTVSPAVGSGRAVALNQSTYCHAGDNSLSFSMDAPEDWLEGDDEEETTYLNETCATDAAVKFTNESIYEHDLEDEDEENEKEYKHSSPAPRASEAYEPADTTMTVDQSPLIDVNSILGAPPAAARLAFEPRHRDKDAVPDMKEITFSTAPGTFVTVMMDFANKHGRPMHLMCQAVPVRFEPASSENTVTQGGNSYFSVSPSELTILPGEDNQLYIKFNPPKGAAGVYSGVLKVKNGQKNFMLLLRGEAVVEQPKEHKHVVESPATRPEVSKTHKSRAVAAEHSNQLHMRQVQLQQRIQMLNSKQASPPTHSLSRSRTSSASSIATEASNSSAAVIVLSTKTETVHSAFASAAPTAIVPGAIRVSPETVQVQQTSGFGGCQFEAYAEIAGCPAAGAQAVTVEVSSSSPLIRLASSQCELTHCNSVARIRMMLDADCTEFQSFSRRFLSSSGSDSVTYHLGFVTVRSGRREFNIDVILSRGTCRAVDDMHRRASSASMVMDTPVKPSVVSAAHYPAAKTLVTASSVTSTPPHSSASIDITRVDSHNQEEHFDRHHSDYSLNTTRFQSVDVVKTRTVHEKSSKVVRSGKKGESSKSFLETKSGVYFRRENTQFGAVTIGSLTRTRLELCNGTDREMIVYLGDVALPFVLLHNELTIRPRSYVRVPMRFLPTHAGEFVQELVAQTADGSYHSTVQMRGSAY